MKPTLLLLNLFAAHACFGMTELEALGAIESGATKAGKHKADYARGRHGEVSRYQILPSIWRVHGRGLRPENPDHSRRVASEILAMRTAQFQHKHERWPTNAELYALWNAPAQAMRGKISKVVMERAKRFENLVAK